MSRSFPVVENRSTVLLLVTIILGPSLPFVVSFHGWIVTPKGCQSSYILTKDISITLLFSECKFENCMEKKFTTLFSLVNHDNKFNLLLIV